MNQPDLTSFHRLGNNAFVSLTTFRKTGVPVSTPVWIARDGDELLVVTPEESGKVKRLRNSPEVEIRPCSRTGKVADDAVVGTGVAEIVVDLDGRLERIMREKYGFQYGLTMVIERLLARRQKPRVFLRLTPAVTPS